MPFATRNGLRLHYSVRGHPEAPALVMVRGLARSKSYWLDLPERLADRFRVVVLDNRGVGHSDAPPPPYSCARMADDLVAVMDHAGIERAHLFGMSLGGMIAQWAALRHPQRIARLALGCTTAGGRAARGVPLDATMALVRCAGRPLDEALRATIPYTLTPEFVERRPDVVAQWMAIARAEPTRSRGIIGQALAGAAHDTSRHLQRIRVPTLVVTGDADRLIPPDNSYHLVERLPEGRLQVLPGAGHDFPTERPEETVSLLSRFLLSR